MKLRQLGDSRIYVSPAGFGAWAIGGPGLMGWGDQDDGESIAAIHHAIELGVNWVDTAAAYGFGHSEEVVGRALKQLPQADRPLIFTKCGLVWDDNGVESRNLQPASIRQECENSLRRLGVETIDLYQIHTVDPDGPPIEESWQTMLELMAEGKVAEVGVSNFTVDLLERCEVLGHVGSLQPPLSLLNRDALNDVIPWCEGHDTGVIAYSPLASGLLTGTFTAARVASLSDGDWRSRDDRFREPGLSRALELVDVLAPIAERLNVTVAAVAAAWVAAQAGVSGAIVGARSADQVDGWIDAAGLDLDVDDLTSIYDGLLRTKAGSGPVKLPVQDRNS